MQILHNPSAAPELTQLLTLLIKRSGLQPYTLKISTYASFEAQKNSRIT